ncbi:MAG: hypothetical protein DMG36_02700, partial [Acidobacteria bacterium]
MAAARRPTALSEGVLVQNDWRLSVECQDGQQRVEALEAPVDNEGVSPHKHRIADYLRPKTLAML